MNSKSILFFINVLYAGAGKILLFVAESCAKAGWEVTIVTFYDKQISSYCIEGVRFINLDIPAAGLMWRMKGIYMIRDAVKKVHPDIICAFISDVVCMTRLAAMGLKPAFIAAERGDPYTLPKKWMKLVKWAYKHSDHCVFQLKGAQDFFDKSIKKNSTIIPNPYSTDYNIEPYLGERKKTVVSVGRFVEQKGYDILIQSFRKFADSHPEYHLIIYGDGPLKEKLSKLADSLKLSEKVSFPGFIHDVTQTIRKDGIFVLSSRFEGIPNVLIEAMSVGVPTVSTNCSPGGPAFLTDGGRRGLLVPVDDVEKLADAMSTIADNKQKGYELSKLGLEILQDLDPEVIRKRWLEMFENELKYKF